MEVFDDSEAPTDGGRNVRRVWLAAILLVACAPADSSPDAAEEVGVPTPPGPLAVHAPPDAPAAWRAIIGEYDAHTDTISVLEDDGALVALRWSGSRTDLIGVGEGAFRSPTGETVTFTYDAAGRPTSMLFGDQAYARLSLGADDGGTFRITPVRPRDELVAEALSAHPPREDGDFRPSDLVELVSLDSTIALDVRYATTNNFMGQVFYSEPRAFLQRPAAEALVRASAWLRERGYGLLVHDGYRPWYVTKMFWDATPEALKVFVADPESGSRHNRGCAVDLTLYDLESGEPVLMTGGYDEMSPRSYPDYPGGTERQRWHRELLRQAMEAQGFSVYEAEWWHFDHQDWRSYRIGNERFEDLGIER